MRGPHGHGSLNEAEKELLFFLSTNDTTECNTWFEKKAIHKQTWQHPKSKQWHCIDYAIMRRAHHRKCLDVAVMRGAECNTDHMMVRVRLQFGKKVFRSGCVKIGERKFDVSNLKGRCMVERGRETTKGRFVSRVFKKMCGMWRCDGSLEKKWSAMKKLCTRLLVLSWAQRVGGNPTGSEIVKMLWGHCLRKEAIAHHVAQHRSAKGKKKASEIAKVRQREERSDMADLPSEEELSSVLGKLKSVKLVGSLASFLK